MPYVTEELWNHLPNTEGSIMVADFPKPDESLVDLQAEEQMAVVMNVTTAIRNIRGEMNVPPAKKVDVLIDAPDPGDRDRKSVV